jgi:hypothetical protein
MNKETIRFILTTGLNMKKVDVQMAFKKVRMSKSKVQNHVDLLFCYQRNYELQM